MRARRAGRGEDFTSDRTLGARLRSSTGVEAQRAEAKPPPARPCVPGVFSLVLAILLSACTSLRPPVSHWYRIAGPSTAPTLIYVHGGPCGSSYQFEQGAGSLLERDFRIIYYDQRGCGRSERVEPESVTMNQLVMDLEEVRAQLAPNQVFLLGSSFGGEIAMEYALRHSQHVQALLLEGSSIGDFQRMARLQIRKLSGTTMSSLTESEYYAAWQNADPSQVDRLLFHQESSARRVRKIWSRETWKPSVAIQRRLLTAKHEGASPLERIRALRVPTLVLVGRYDFSTGVDMSRDIAKAVPGAKLVIFENSAHFVHSEEPEKYREEILRFTQRVASP